MFQLFKLRGFAEYISDTFTFIKFQGKNYFKNYLKFAFIALLLLMVSMSMIGTFYYRVLTTTLGTTMGGDTFDNAFVSENGLMLGIGFLTLFIISLYLGMLNYSYPVYYLHLVGKNGNEKPSLKSIRELFKNDFGRLLLFGLLSFLTFIIVGIIAFSIAVVLSFVIIGIFIIILLVPFFITWYSLTLYFYIDKKQDFFVAFKHAFYTITNNFWNIVGASLCMLIIVQVLSTIVTMIPYMITIFGFVLGMQSSQNVDSANLSSNISIMMVIIVIIYCFSILVSTILNHLLLIQNGLVYYSEREKLEYNSMRQSIDEIGKHE